MAHIRKILVPIDGSAASRAAHSLALDLAAAYRAELIVLYVVDSSALEELSRLSGEETPRLIHDMEESGRSLLASRAREADTRAVTTTQDLHHGMPDEIIMREATRHQADLIVMGKVGRKGHRRSLLGSVTERVLESSDLPVLVVSPP